MENKALTISVIVEAQSLNYDEGFANVSVLKKLRRGSGEVYTYCSRQALRYSIIHQAHEQFGWKLTPVTQARGAQGAGKVLQFSREELGIKDYPEIDLFGYMSTEEKERGATYTRSATVRLTPLFSLEPFTNDVEFLTSKWMADRFYEVSGQITPEPNIANIEHHRSLYTYSLTVDLDRIGTEEWNISLGKEKRINILTPAEKAERVAQFLQVVKTLYRDIRGRREDLKPKFLIGAVLPIKNPIFLGCLKIKWKDTLPELELEPIEEALNFEYAFERGGKQEKGVVKDNAIIGLTSGFFGNENEIKKVYVAVKDISGAFDELITKVEEAYGVRS